MTKIIKVLSEPMLRGMYEKLKGIDGNNEFQTLLQSHIVARKAAVEFNDLLSSYTFNDQLEEIHCYKDLLPIIYTELYFFEWQYDLIANKPIGNSAKIDHYFHKEIKKHQKYFNKNQEFLNYYKLQQTHMDTVYFTKNIQSPMPPEFHPGHLGNENTAIYYSMKLAKIQAAERLIGYIESELNCLHSTKLPAPKKGGNLFVWTDTKIALIEIVYALHAKGAINNGNTKIGQLIKFFEGVFHIDLGNHYAAYHQNMKLRALKRTSYLKKLKDTLDNYMEDDNEKEEL